MSTHKPAEKAHAKYSASGSYRWLNCPGSIRLSEGRTSPDSKYSIEGTRAHHCVEQFLKKSLGPLATAARLKNEGYPKAMIEHAEETYWEILKRTPKGADRGCETKVDASFFTKAGQFGTVDAYIAEHYGTLEVIDFKYGAGIPVDPEDNTQMIYYALGLAKLYAFDFQTVRLTIIQPRAYHRKGPNRSHDVPMDKLMGWQYVFREGVKEAEKKDAPVKPGEWCRFCPAEGICPAVGNQKKQQMIDDFMFE